MAKDMADKLGSWSFILSVVLAVILGAVNVTAAWVYGLLLVLGLIVGLLNVTSSEIVPFLIACVALLVAAPSLSMAIAQSDLASWLGWLSRILSLVAVFVVPAAVVGALKAIAALAHGK